MPQLNATTPRLFRHGLPAEARLAILVVLALALLVGDSQWRVLEPVRRAVSVALYPFQRAVLLPRDMVQQVSEWYNAANLVRSENEALQRQRIELAQVATHAAQMAAENAQLRRLLGVTDIAVTAGGGRGSALRAAQRLQPAAGFQQGQSPGPGAGHAGHRRRRRGGPDRAGHAHDGRGGPGHRRAGVHPPCRSCAMDCA